MSEAKPVEPERARGQLAKVGDVVVWRHRGSAPMHMLGVDLTGRVVGDWSASAITVSDSADSDVAMWSVPREWVVRVVAEPKPVAADPDVVDGVRWTGGRTLLGKYDLQADDIERWYGHRWYAWHEGRRFAQGTAGSVLEARRAAIAAMREHEAEALR